MPPTFRQATKSSARLRMAIAGPAGAGKTYTALGIGTALGSPVAVIDTERGSASKYADLFSFDVLELDSFHPERYIEAIRAAEEAGYAVVVIDSLSHAWMGRDGALELVDRAAKRSQSNNSWAAWRDVTPLHNQLVDAMIQADLHVIVTLRSKTEHVQEKDDRGRTVIRKVGLAPVQRDGLEYEFDVYGDMDQDNNLIIGKTRLPALAGQVIAKPGEQLAKTLKAWLQGAPPPTNGVPEGKAAPSPSGGTSARQKVRNPDELIESVQDPLYQRYSELAEEAQDLGVEWEVLSLPIRVAELTKFGAELKTRVDAARAQREPAAQAAMV